MQPKSKLQQHATVTISSNDTLTRSNKTFFFHYFAGDTRGKQCLFSYKASLCHGVQLPAVARIVTVALALVIHARPALAVTTGTTLGTVDYLSSDDWNATAYDVNDDVPPVPADQPVQCQVCVLMMQNIVGKTADLPVGSRPFCQVFISSFDCLDKYGCDTDEDLRGRLKSKCKAQMTQPNRTSLCSACVRRMQKMVQNLNFQGVESGSALFCRTLAPSLTCLQVKKCVTTGVDDEVRIHSQLFCSRRLDTCGICLVRKKQALHEIRNVSATRLSQVCDAYYEGAFCLRKHSCVVKPESGSNLLIVQGKCSWANALAASRNVARRVAPMPGSLALAWLTVVAALTVFTQ